MFENSFSRRSLLQGAAAAAAWLGLSRFGSAQPTLAPTPEVPDHDEPTPAEEEGPFFKPKSPERRSIREGVKGTTLLVEGRVLSTEGKPIPGALLEFWHCDADGVYDNTGFKLRGHQHADKDGRFTLETIVPGVYPGRCRHIHVKVQAPHGPMLTSQLYFPGEERNKQDHLYMKQLEMKLSTEDAAKSGKFDFVVRTA